MKPKSQVQIVHHYIQTWELTNLKLVVTRYRSCDHRQSLQSACISNDFEKQHLKKLVRGTCFCLVGESFGNSP